MIHDILHWRSLVCKIVESSHIIYMCIYIYITYLLSSLYLYVQVYIHIYITKCCYTRHNTHTHLYIYNIIQSCFQFTGWSSFRSWGGDFGLAGTPQADKERDARTIQQLSLRPRTPPASRNGHDQSLLAPYCYQFQQSNDRQMSQNQAFYSVLQCLSVPMT